MFSQTWVPPSPPLSRVQAADPTRVSCIQSPPTHALHHTHSDISNCANFIKLLSFVKTFKGRKASSICTTKICEPGLPGHLCPYYVPSFPLVSLHQPHASIFHLPCGHRLWRLHIALTYCFLDLS